MDNSEDLDLDSLMELLDDNEQFEADSSSTQSVNTPSANISTTNSKQSQNVTEVSDKIPSNKISLSEADLFSSKQGEHSTKIIPNGKSYKISLSEVDLFSSERSEPSTNGKSSQSNPNQNDAWSSHEERLQALKSGFKENLLNPQMVENPKKDEMYERHMFNKKESALFNFGELGSSDEEIEQEDKEFLNKTGKLVKKELEAQQLPSYHEHKRTTIPTWKSAAKSSNDLKSQPGESFIVDSYSGIRIVNPLVSFGMLQQRMKDRKMIKMSFIQNYVKGGDIEGDWVTMGVILSKVPPKTSKNGKPYSIWKMSDLHDPEKPISIFLFRAAHTDHWKTTVGTVLGILNPSIMPNNNKSGELCIAVDHPGKFMLMGKSKDLGFCKSKRKDGNPCNIAVNKFQCEYCTYHVKNEYKKFSAKRSELQASYNGREPSLKNRLLKGTNVFYGGQNFTAPAKKPSNTLKSKDKLTLSNLGLKRKASEALELLVEKEKGVKKLAELYGPEILPAANCNSEFINAQLAKPTVGSRNLLQHLMKEKPNKDGEAVTVISPKELLKMRDMSARGVLQKHKNDSTILKNLAPQLGRGLQPGQEFSLEFSPSVVNRNTQNFAKMRAIKKIKEQGQIKRKDPNSVKVSLKATAKVQAVLEKSHEEEKGDSQDVVEAKSSVVMSTLGSIDLNSEKVKAMLKRGSTHAYEVETAEMQKEAAYFNVREKKEQMEEKMASTKEIVCDVVSCLKCKYTADTAAERCKKEQHPLKCHKALKRFFECKDCQRRTFGFSRLPKMACRGCHGSNFERTSMMKVRKGPKLEYETLNICADDRYFINSL